MNSNENPIIGKQEKFDLKIEIAKPNPKNSKAYGDLRVEAISGEYQDIFGADPERVAAESQRTSEEWQSDLSRQDMFVILAWNGDNAVGMARALDKGQGTWHTQSGYVKKEFQNKKIGSKMFAARILEMKNRGAKRVTLMVDADNLHSIHVNESLGFRKTTEEPQSGTTSKGKEFKYYKMEIELTDQVLYEAKKVLYEK